MSVESHRSESAIRSVKSGCEDFDLLELAQRGHAVAQLVEALRYKPEGRRFDSRWCHWIFFIDILQVALCPWGRFSL
jgi:hypothetical protein